jgi:hypothetical protein
MGSNGGSVPGNKENNMTKKSGHESLSISTAAGGSSAFHSSGVHHHVNRGELSSAHAGHHHQALGSLQHASGYAPPQSA